MSDRHVHDQRFDGDSPILVCHGCGRRWDALTGEPLRDFRAADLRTPAPPQAELREAAQALRLAVTMLERAGVMPVAVHPIEEAMRRAEASAVAATPDLREAALTFLNHVEQKNLGLPRGCDGSCAEGRALRDALSSPATSEPTGWCVECGEAWPCDATVRRVKDGIPHRMTRSDPEASR